MKGCWLVLMFFIYFSAYSQKKNDGLYDGLVVRELDTLRGKVSYDFQSNTVVVQNVNGVFTGSPRTVVAFEIFDTEINNYRKFYSLPDASVYYNNSAFFELLNDGKLTLLSREHIEQQTTGYSYYSYTTDVFVVEYYQLNPNGKVEPLMSGKKDWLQLMTRHRDKVEEFVKKNKLRWEYKYDLQKIVAYYNSLFIKP